MTEPLAIIGMACRFPGAPDLDAYWELLEEGRNAVSESVPGSGIGRTSDAFGDREGQSDLCRYGGFLTDVDQFDAAFFRMSPLEAQIVDPQQRLTLETTWRALEDAGLNPDRLRGTRTGVFTGVSNMEYREVVFRALDHAPESVGRAARLYANLSTNLNGISGRLAFLLGLQGPAMAVDTACSSSLVATHEAAMALQHGEVDLAVVAGVNLILDPRRSESYAEAGTLSPEGQCKAFDASADGWVRGEGCGVVVVKRLRDAVADGDRIWTVLRGSAVNHDGASTNYAAPNDLAQRRVFREALDRAGVAPSAVDYVEAHGTGTPVGDPIELSAVAAVYSEGRDPERPLLIGSAKSNLGHLEPAAGVAGLIKTVLAIHHGVIPRHLHFNTPNPAIEWDRLPVQVAAETTAWPDRPDHPRLAGVSSYGMTGTNAHIILEGYEGAEVGSDAESARPAAAASRVGVALPEPFEDVDLPEGPFSERSAMILPLSGRDEAALRELAGSYVSWLDRAPATDATLPDIAWTAGTGRSHFSHRTAVLFRDEESLRDQLTALADGATRVRPGSASKVAFAYTGQGSQWLGMGRDLYETEPVARAVMDRCEAVHLEERGESLLDVMFGRDGAKPVLDDTDWAQPALYALECAMTALWASVGVRPDVVIGHSFGELPAAQTAGVFGLEDGMRLAIVRGRLMYETEPGAGVAIFAPRADVEAAIEEINAASERGLLGIASDNGLNQVVTGLASEVDAISAHFEAQEIRARRMDFTRAAHSPLLDPMLPELEASADAIDTRPPGTEFVSNIDGEVRDAGVALDGAYWSRHVRQPVAFADSVKTLSEIGVDTVIEIGPHAVLGPMIEMIWPQPPGTPGAAVVIPTMQRPEERGGSEAASSFTEAVAEAYTAGLDLSFEGLFTGEERRRVSIPGYPFQRSSYWFTAPRQRRAAVGHPLLGLRHESPNGEISFESEIEPSNPPWLEEHRVFGRVVAPGALYAALAASALLSEGATVLMDDLQLFSPLIFPEAADGEEQSRRLQVILGRPDEQQRRRVEIFSKGADTEWTLHASGSVPAAAPPDGAGASIDVEAAKAGLTRGDPRDLYRVRSGAGVELGPPFRGLTALWQGPGEALGEIALPGLVDRNGIEIHPLLLDACSQVMSGGRSTAEGDTTVYMPFGWERLWLTGPLPERLVCRAELRDAGASASDEPAEVIKADLWIYDEDGVAIGEVSGFTVKRATRAALLSALDTVDDLMHEVVWRERPLGESEEAAEPTEHADADGDSPGVWILAADRGGVADRLAASLAGRGQTVVLAGDAAGDVPPSAEPGAVNAAVDAGSRESWRSLIEGVPEGAPLRGVVHLAALDGHGARASTEELRDDVTSGLGSALALVQGLIDADAAPQHGVWFVSRGGQVLREEQRGELGGAMLWGFGKVVTRELAQLPARVVDLDPDDNEIPDAFIDELLGPDAEDLVAYRAGTRFVQRIVRGRDGAAQATPPDDAASRVRGDRTYLVTGGLGGVGGATAGWLADNGARTIVLNGRRAPGPAAEEVIRSLRERGVELHVELADVANMEQLRAMLARIDASLPPLGGVVHSAVALSDGALINQTWAGFEEAIWAKVLGAWELHRQTEDRDLDLFILYTSMAGVRGNPGQSNYAAANTFCDELARHRRALGLPGQSVQWGAWGSVGGGEQRRDRLEGVVAASGYDWMTPAQGIRALDRVVREDLAVAGVTLIDWDVYAASLRTVPPLIEELLSAPAQSDDSEAAGDLVSRLREAPEQQRYGIVEDAVQGLLQELLRMPSPPDPNVTFFDLGLDSLMALELRARLNLALGGAHTVSNTIAFDYPDIASLAGHLVEVLDSEPDETPEVAALPAAPRPPRQTAEDAIAIVGMACKFPGADDLAAFWELLEAGASGVSDARNGSGPWADFFGDAGTEDDPHRRAGFVEGVDQFDASFFRISPIEARNMDPQLRMLLETTWHAIEDAGIDPDTLRGSRTGTYAGIGLGEYRDVMTLRGKPIGYVGINGSTAIGRVAFTLGLEGPALPVEVACASSLVAVHHAVTALRHGEINLALVAGVNAALSPDATLKMAELGMLSSGGECLTFNAGADGFIRGEGCGVVVLKRLGEALEDGDRIWAVVRGSGVNQSGVSAGPTAPSGLAQQHVIEQALSSAGVDPADVDYLEAHGTASELGDAIELEAAAAVYGRGREAERPLLIGSVKTNIGHTESASGMAGLIKAVLAMQRGVIPAHLHFREPSQHVEWERLPLQVTDSATEWPQHADREPLAAVSAFGLTGANAHVVVEGYTSGGPAPGAWAPGAPQPVALPSPDGMELPGPEEIEGEGATRLLPLSARSDDALRDLARDYLAWIESPEGAPAESTLADAAWTAGVGRSHFPHRAGVVFADAGALRDGLRAIAGSTDSPEPQVARRVGFAYDAEVDTSPSAARALYDGEPVARSVLDRCEEVFRAERQTSLLGAMFGEDAPDGLEDAAWRQPAAYALQCALTALWSSAGIRPDAVQGHGVGELAAAQAAGVLSLEAGLRLAVARARLASDDGGSRDADSALAMFEAALAGSPPSRASIPVVSSETGEPVGANTTLDAAYWLRQARLPASASDGSGALGGLGMDVVMTIGLEADVDPSDAFVRAVAQAYEAGLDLAFAGLFAGELRRRVAIPGYPFQHRRYWLEPVVRG
ncbi:MAG: SDR family NAD(P)-dependent oxidoreductase [Chloroflexi bacterium]|nr:SDR family NAD(P)-dependent oxidoreductase [Chloroflexota bacterium]